MYCVIDIPIAHHSDFGAVVSLQCVEEDPDRDNFVSRGRDLPHNRFDAV